MRVYTRTGDKGTTGLVGGSRVAKSDPRIECLGLLDELNARVGSSAVIATQPLVTKLHQIQSLIFSMGAEVATPPDSSAFVPSVTHEDSQLLEVEMDQAEAELEPLKNFILPGGTELASRLHLSRTACRQAERFFVSVQSELELRSELLIYLNRLSDWFFMYARIANYRSNVQDINWTNRGN